MMRKFPGSIALVLTAAIAAAVTLAAPVAAQGRLSLSERIARLEAQQQAQGSGQTQVELLNRLNELQTELQSLRGLIEQQTFEIDGLKKTVRDRYVDLDSRMGRIEGGAAPGASASPTPAPDIAQHQAGAADAADTVAQFVGAGAGVGADAHLIEGSRTARAQPRA